MTPISYRRDSHGRFTKSDKSDNPEPYKMTEFETYAYYISLTTPDRDKEFGGHTDQFFCKKYKVHPDTLSDWSDNPKLWRLRDKHLFRTFKKITPNIIKSLEIGAVTKKDAQLIKLYLEKIEGWLTPVIIEDSTPSAQKQPTITADDILDMIPNEKLRKRIRMKLLQKKYQDRLPG